MEKYLVMTDMDGTLFDTAQVNYLAYANALSTENIWIDEEYFRVNCFGLNYKEFLIPLLGNNNQKIELIHKIKTSNYKQYLNATKRNEALYELLKYLKVKGNIIALVTTASKKNVDQILDYYKMIDFFDEIVYQESVKNVKPNSECYEIVKKKYGFSNDRCIIFEDSEIGLLSAKNASDYVFCVEKF